MAKLAILYLFSIKHTLEKNCYLSAFQQLSNFFPQKYLEYIACRAAHPQRRGVGDGVRTFFNFQSRS